MIELSSVGDSGFLKMNRSQKTGSEKWADIEDLINRWAKRSPQKARDLEQYIKNTRGGLYDAKFAKTTESLGRMGLAIDPDLEMYIKAFYPDFMSTKDEMHEFMRRFPKFCIPERI